ncbi:MAG TPA: sugar phosphate nucleotidyltransferase [Candidatus Magasanikbacteria bacterium]|jgi:D-glycero-alpha-D-manno-heptose 1-phosphate guanylyltransferase|nr:sugar phosphate nucleotidyltransferase [Candidatus Magasanikbacteria bacterium]
MNAIILCGGLSTRLGEITKTIPKILLPIGPKRVFDWQMEKLKKMGIKEVVLAAGHLANNLREQVGTEWQGIKIIYAIENKKLGTGGAIKHALEYVLYPEKPTIILNGDILTTVSFVDMVKYLRSNSDGIILGSYVPDVSSYGTLVYDSNYHLQSFKEKEGINKSGYQNGGVYIFNPQIKKYFPATEVFSIEYDVFPNVKDLDVYESDKPWIDIGIPERLEWARENYHKFLIIND